VGNFGKKIGGKMTFPGAKKFPSWQKIGGKNRNFGGEINKKFPTSHSPHKNPVFHQYFPTWVGNFWWEKNPVIYCALLYIFAALALAATATKQAF